MSKVISSISYDQTEILASIIKLHCPNGIEVDPTFSTGRFYKDLPMPKFKFDISPQFPDVTKTDCRNLPFNDETVESIIFDPPFIVGVSSTGQSTGIMGSKRNFGYYKNIADLWSMYQESLIEFYSILIPKGVLVVKCQDTISCGIQYFSEYKILKEALKVGFYPKDKFILLSKTRMIGATHRTQQHARKFHSYFLVFIKMSSRAKY